VKDGLFEESTFGFPGRKGERVKLLADSDWTTDVDLSEFFPDFALAGVPAFFILGFPKASLLVVLGKGSDGMAVFDSKDRVNIILGRAVFHMPSELSRWGSRDGALLRKGY